MPSIHSVSAATAASTKGSQFQGPFSATGNEKFDWANEINVGAI